MRVLTSLVEADKSSLNPTVTDFVQDQFKELLKSSKFHEMVERVAFNSNVNKDKALKLILEELAAQTNEVIKGKKKSAASLELILR